MNKKLLIIIYIIFFFVIDATISYAKQNNKSDLINENMKVIYISYLEYLNNFYGNTSKINKTKINKMIDVIKENNFNTIILHVSPFSDSIYNSKIFPYSYTLTGIEGKNPGFDYLDYFIKVAHAKGIKIHAWLNPYRISFSQDINQISKQNPAYKLINTESVYIDKKGIYYNPASSIVKELIVKQVKEIIDNYNVDGIHFDDYFYIQDKIDEKEYKNTINSGIKVSLKDFRLNNTNDLIKMVYKVIKNKNEKIVFSIAPDGNINNNYLYHFADVKKWLSSNEYIDIIMPQIYYGFRNEYSPFLGVLNNWKNICKNKKIKIVPILAYYKIGVEDYEAGIGKNEWIEDMNVINKQIKIINDYNLYGYGIFRYDYFVKNS